MHEYILACATTINVFQNWTNLRFILVRFYCVHEWNYSEDIQYCLCILLLKIILSKSISRWTFDQEEGMGVILAAGDNDNYINTSWNCHNNYVGLIDNEYCLQVNYSSKYY